MSGKLLRLVIMGAPGSGKGTISSRIVKEFGLVHISSGDLLRKQILNGSSPAGVSAKTFVDQGQLVPDELVVRLILEELTSFSGSGWLLDGFPRTLSQAKELDQNSRPGLVLNLDVPVDEIQQRLEGRWIHVPSGRVYNLGWNPPLMPGLDDITGEPLVQREDDKPEVVCKRLLKYTEQTFPLIQYYRHLGLLVNFPGTESNVIYKDVRRVLSKLVA